MSLDRNCLTAIEEQRDYAPAVLKLLAAHRAGTIDLALNGMSASEMRKDKTYPERFEEFEDWAESLGFGGLPILLPLGMWDITFWGKSVYASEQQAALHNEIYDILFPTSPRDLKGFCAQMGLSPEKGGKGWQKWVNRACDVECMRAHIGDGRTVFVTNDDNFIKLTKAPVLKERWGVITAKPDVAAEMLG
ncbi:hypothetical protein [Lacibacterium aquatile]